MKTSLFWKWKNDVRMSNEAGESGRTQTGKMLLIMVLVIKPLEEPEGFECEIL